MSSKILILPGDGIGPEIVEQAVGVLEVLRDSHGLDIEWEHGLLGGAAYDEHGHPYPEATQSQAKEVDAILLGAVGGPKWDEVDRELRPEKGLLGIRADLGLFANLRPAILFPELAEASSLKPELVSGLDILIVRELTGGIYFGQPRGIEDGPPRKGFNTLVYDEEEITRIARAAGVAAQRRDKRLCSVDKENVLEASQLWREVMIRVISEEFPDVELSHMYVDNAAMQLVRAPKQFDVMVTGNMFGDILSDIAAMLTGSIGMLPSASLDVNGKGMYEPVHGSAPDIAGQGVANPLATILSVAMMLRHSLDRGDLADKVEQAVGQVLRDGLRTADIANEGSAQSTTQQMGQAVVDALN